MEADGSNVTRLTEHSSTNGGPAWSPDGTRIAFLSTRDHPDEYSVYDGVPDGGRRLQRHPAHRELCLRHCHGVVVFVARFDYIYNADDSHLAAGHECTPFDVMVDRGTRQLGFS